MIFFVKFRNITNVFVLWMKKLILRLFFYNKHIITSAEFIAYLRSQGVQIGDNVFFQSPQTACVDVTRPLLVEIGDNCTILEP